MREEDRTDNGIGIFGDSIDKYGDTWGPWLSVIDEYRKEQNIPALTTEQIAEASKSLENVMQRHKFESIAHLPDNLIEAAMTRINDMDLDLDFITLEQYSKNHERINTVLKEHRVTFGGVEI